MEWPPGVMMTRLLGRYLRRSIPKPPLLPQVPWLDHLLPSRAWFQTAAAAAILFVGADAAAQYLEATHGGGATTTTTPTTAATATEHSPTKNKANHNNNHNNTAQQRAQSPATPVMAATWYDPWRGTGAAVLGVVLGGGVYPTAYAQLDRLLPGNSWRTLLCKSAVEIVTVGISVNTASLVGRATWQGTHAWSDVRAHVTTEIPRVTWMDAQIWFPYNVVAFGWIPLPIRPLTTACVEAGWQTWISLRAHAFSNENGKSP